MPFGMVFQGSATMPVQFDFAGQVAIVTGGSRGIGRGIAERLVNAGATVHNFDRAPGPQLSATHHSVDVTDRAALHAAVDAVLGEVGRIDVLVNNAGAGLATGPSLEVDPDAWRRSFDLNVFAVFELSRLVLPIMERAGYGRVVNMASLAGKEGTPGLSAYSAAKAAVIALTKSLAKEMADTDIRINAIAPGGVETELLETLPTDTVATMLAKVPIGRFGTVDEIATLTLFLASDACSLSTGVTFDASGGRATY